MDEKTPTEYSQECFEEWSRENDIPSYIFKAWRQSYWQCFIAGYNAAAKRAQETLHEMIEKR